MTLGYCTCTSILITFLRSITWRNRIFSFSPHSLLQQLFAMNFYLLPTINKSSTRQWADLRACEFTYFDKEDTIMSVPSFHFLMHYSGCSEEVPLLVFNFSQQFSPWDATTERPIEGNQHVVELKNKRFKKRITQVATACMCATWITITALSLEWVSVSRRSHTLPRLHEKTPRIPFWK